MLEFCICCNGSFNWFSNRGLMGLRLGGAAAWLCRGWGHRGGRVCSAESNVSPRYQNFFINEDTQTSEGRGWGLGADEGAVCKHTSPPSSWLAVPDLTTCFLAAAPHKSPARPCTMWLTIIIAVFAEAASPSSLLPWGCSTACSWKWRRDTWGDTRTKMGQEAGILFICQI